MDTPAQSLHTRLETERAAAQPEAALIKRFRAYAVGKQKSTLTREQARALQGVTGNRHADNVCGMVLAAHASRCQIARWEVAPSEANSASAAQAAEAVNSWVTALWGLAGGSYLHNQVTHATLRDGSHAVALAWDNALGRVRLVREPWWDGTAGLWLAYGDDDQPAYAVKEWQDSKGRARRVVWWPDRIQRYIQADGWQPYADPAADGVWESRWVQRDGTPLGLPVVHFRNASPTADTREADNHYPPSLLDGGVLGLQDEINDVQRDITAAARYTGFQMYAFFGVGLDKAGNVYRIDVSPGAVHTVAGQGSAMVLPAGNIAALENTLHIKYGAVSRNTSTPVAVITNVWPSGDALERAMDPLIAAVEALEASMGPPWGSLLHKATLLDNTFGEGRHDTAALIRPVYRPAQPQAPQVQATRVATLAPLISEEEALRQLGYDPGQVANIMQERADTAARDTALSFAGGLPNG